MRKQTPTKMHRNRTRQENVLTAEQKSYLLHGIDLGQLDEVDAQSVWRVHRVELLAEFIREHPGRRPYGWWVWIKPASLLRRQIYGPEPLPDSQIHMGYPSWWPNKSLIFESEVEFLWRNQLLTRAESKDFLTLKEKARAAQKQYFVNRGYTHQQLDRIFEDWDSCEDKWAVGRTK